MSGVTRNQFFATCKNDRVEVSGNYFEIFANKFLVLYRYNKKTAKEIRIWNFYDKQKSERREKNEEKVQLIYAMLRLSLKRKMIKDITNYGREFIRETKRVQEECNNYLYEKISEIEKELGNDVANRESNEEENEEKEMLNIFELSKEKLKDCVKHYGGRTSRQNKAQLQNNLYNLLGKKNEFLFPKQEKNEKKKERKMSLKLIKMIMIQMMEVKNRYKIIAIILI